ncbi:hypothetical protein G7046_g8670 [Stylonectria norvegica]|nr:hypothetical protein G7046_g8670 [Stylonectria norvegica]
MASTGVNVLRWSALGLGIFYGFAHQQTITSTQRSQHAQHEYEHKQKLIDQAKAEFAKQKNPKAASGDDGMSLTIRPIDSQASRWPGPKRGGIGQLGTSELTSFAVITDVADPKFDLEKLLLKVSKENP